VGRTKDRRGCRGMELGGVLAKRWIILVFGVFGVCGCAPKNPDMLHFLPEREHSVSAIEYRVGIPDAVSISAPRIIEIDGETERIRPDGKIGLKLLGDVKVVGMTAKEIAAKLEVLLGKYYVEPKVSIRVAAYGSKKFYVYGEGIGGGTRPYTGRDTLLDVVMPAVTNFLAWTNRVQVIRPAHGDTPVRVITVDVKKMVETGDWSQNILLEPNDVVWVPPTIPAKFAQVIREVFFPVGPAVQAYAAPAAFKALDRVYNGDDDNSSVIIGTGGFSTPY